MSPWNDRRASRNERPRRRRDRVVLEDLERRDLLAFTSLGHSLPDLTVSGFAAPVASWGGTMTVTLDVHDIGSSSMIEPLSLGANNPPTPVPYLVPLPQAVTSTADAPASTAEVFVSRRSVFNPLTAVPVQSIAIPAIPENNDAQVTTSITLPNRPRGFPGDGGQVFLFYVANANKAIEESDLTNNVSAAQPVQIAAPFPELTVVGFDVPPTIQPGDTIQPNIRIENLGPADTAPQGPVTVVIAASTTPTFGPGSTIVGTYSVANIPGASTAPSQGQLVGDANLDPGNNIVTINGGIITLPTAPATYYIGVVIDPFNQIKQLQSVGSFRASNNPFSLPQLVGPPIIGLPPAGVTNSATDPTALFPNPVSGIPIGSPADTTLFPTPAVTGPVSDLLTTTAVHAAAIRAQRTHKVRPHHAVKAPKVD